MTKKLVLDAGHGAHDAGAVANGLKEKDLTLDIAKRIKNKLNNYDIDVIMTRTTDKYLTLSERTNIANRNNADAFVSIHINAGGGTGFESFIFNGTVSNATKQLQNKMHDAIVNKTNMTNRGKKKANFAVVRQTRMPSILTENLFIDRKEDADKLKDSKFIDKIAQGHVDGIVSYFNLSNKGGTSKPTQKPKPTSKPPKKASKSKLTVDGKWGKSTTRALQKALGTPVDGIISKQPRNSVSQSLYGGTVQFGNGGSDVIVALQRKVKVNVDGKLGPATVRGLQRYLGTPVDGILSRPSLVVKELQRRLNAGTF